MIPTKLRERLAEGSVGAEQFVGALEHVRDDGRSPDGRSDRLSLGSAGQASDG